MAFVAQGIGERALPGKVIRIIVFFKEILVAGAVRTSRCAGIIGIVTIGTGDNTLGGIS